MLTTSSTLSRRLAPAALVLLAGLAAPAQGQTWDGFGATDNWSDGGNWSGAPAPVSSNSTNIFYGAGFRLNSVQNIAPIFQLFDLTFNASAGNYVLSGNEIQFVGGRLFYNTASTITINNNLSVATGFGALNIQGTGTGTLQINGNILTSTTLAKTGAYTLLLSGNNSLSGAVSIGDASNNGGVLGVSNSAALGTSTSMTIGAGSTFRVFGSFAQTRTISAQGTLGGIIDITGANTLTQNGTISGTTLTKIGTGTLILGNTGSFTGQLTIQGGVVQATLNSQLGSAAGVISIQNGSILRANNAFAISRTLNIGAGGGTLELNHAGSTNLTTLTGSTVFNKEGTGLLNLTGIVGNSFSGQFNINGGVVQTAASASTGTGSVAISNGAILRVNSGWNNSQPLAMGTGGGVIDVPTGLAIYNGVVGGTKLTKSGAGRLNIVGGSNLAQGIDLTGGDLDLSGAFTGAALTSAAGTNLFGAGSFSGAVNLGGAFGTPGGHPFFAAGNLALGTAGDLNIEFNQLGSPTWANAADTGNDVLRLTGLSPLSAVAGAAIDVFLNVGPLVGGEIFRGGLFTDASGDFLPALASALVRVYVPDVAGPVAYAGQNYSLIALPYSVSTQPESAAIGAGVVNGRILQIAVVPTPGAAGLAALGGLVAMRRRRA